VAEGEKTLSVRLPFSMFQTLKQIAELRGRTVSELVREIIKDYVERHGLADGGAKPTIAPYVVQRAPRAPGTKITPGTPMQRSLIVEVESKDLSKQPQEPKTLGELEKLSNEELLRILKRSRWLTEKYFARLILEKRGVKVD